MKSCQAKKEQAAAARMPASGRPPVETVSNQVDATGSYSVFASICSPSSLQKPKYRGQVLQSFFTTEMSDDEVQQMQVHLVKLFADAGFFFRLVECQSFRLFVETIFPGASKHLPGCTTLSGPLLEKRRGSRAGDAVAYKVPTMVVTKRV